MKVQDLRQITYQADLSYAQSLSRRRLSRESRSKRRILFCISLPLLAFGFLVLAIAVTAEAAASPLAVPIGVACCVPFIAWIVGAFDQ